MSFTLFKGSQRLHLSQLKNTLLNLALVSLLKFKINSNQNFSPQNYNQEMNELRIAQVSVSDLVFMSALLAILFRSLFVSVTTSIMMWGRRRVSVALLGPMSLLPRGGLGGVVRPLAAQQAAALTQMPWEPRLIKKVFVTVPRHSLI
jgi:hypothetical protein